MRPIRHSDGVLVSAVPRQVNMEQVPTGQRDTYAPNAMAEFEFEERVLSNQGYRLGREADLSPVDLALG